jgi:hypothetical protein
MSDDPTPFWERPDKALDEYAEALGKVAHAWNTLQLHLGALFVALIPSAQGDILAAVWHSQQSDRSQRRMIRAAIAAGALNAKAIADETRMNWIGDIEWLINNADSLGSQRDAAIHAPAMINKISDEHFEVRSAYYLGNILAERLKNKSLAKEFHALSFKTEQLYLYANKITNSVRNHEFNTWPDKRPSLSPPPRRGQ